MQPGAPSFQLRKSCSETQSKHLTGSSQNDAYELLSSWGDGKHQTPLAICSITWVAFLKTLET